MKKFGTITQTVKENKGVILDKNCNGWIAINTGLVDATVNGISIKAGSATATGESFAVSGNHDEIYSSRIDIAFTTFPGGEITIVQQIYLD